MKIDIITGMNIDEINKIYEISILDGLIYFPETFVHPRIMCENILKTLNEYKKNYNSNGVVIKTFSSDVINMFGALIHHGYIDNKDVKVHIMINNEIKKLYYNKDGYLQDFSIGFFSYDLENAIENIKNRGE